MFGDQSENSAHTNGPIKSLDPPKVITPSYIKTLVSHLSEQQLLTQNQANILIYRTRKLLEQLPNVLEITIPKDKHISIIGDTHGRLSDVLKIFKLNGYPSETNYYLINGNWVDKGPQGVELTLLFFALKLTYPTSFHLIRGNHETIRCTQKYGFHKEVKHKYGETIYNTIMYTFAMLPFAAIVNSKAFICHGGLFPKANVTIAELNSLKRERDHDEDSGDRLIQMMLWSDPMQTHGIGQSKHEFGCSFGPNITADFLLQNNLELLVRSHEVQQEGYSMTHSGRTITVFSCPSFGQETNKGAILHLSTIDPQADKVGENGAHCIIRPLQFTMAPAAQPRVYFEESLFDGL